MDVKKREIHPSRSMTAMPRTMDSTITLNPLQIFPSKKDSVTKVFHGVEIVHRKKRLESLDKWLNPEALDPKFGISGDSQETFIRRSYRRINSTQLFNQLNPNDAPLSELSGRHETKGKKYVLVEQSRLSELTKFENVLREEKALLGEQCAWVLSDIQTSPHIPIPATRLAMHNLCESKMRSVADQLMELNKKWNLFVKQNHYDRPHLFTKETYLQSAPLSQKALKLKMV